MEELVPVVLVIIILVAWAVILGPNLWKRRSRAVGGITSISHFHRQLQVLEHSSPEPLVAPAYRLRTVDGSGAAPPVDRPEVRVAAPKLTVVGVDRLPRPALAFLGEPATGSDGQPAAAASSGLAPAHHGPFPPPARSIARPTDGPARARRRRRDTLGVLALVFTLTLLIGFIPGASVAWAFTLVSGLAVAAYVALLVRMRQMAEERERKLHYLRPAVDPQAAIDDRPVRISGRYAHPSHQAAAR